MFVKDILAGKASGEIYSVSKSDSVSHAAEMLSKHRIGAVIVREGRGPVEGIMSERDIVRELGKRGTGCLNDKVADLMTSEVTTCTPSDNVQEVMTKMTKGRFRHVPVIDGGKLTGVISIGDVVAARIKEVEQENGVMLELITGQF